MAADDDRYVRLSTLNTSRRVFELMSHTGTFAALFISVISIMLAYYEFKSYRLQNEIQQKRTDISDEILTLALRQIERSVVINGDMAVSVEKLRSTTNSIQGSENADAKTKFDAIIADLQKQISELRDNDALLLRSYKGSPEPIPQKKTENSFSLISKAQAQVTGARADIIGGGPYQSSPTSQGWTIDSLRPAVMLGVIAVISLFFFVCIWLFCSSKEPEKIKFADNMMRTIIGFYIGIVTGLLGLPAR